MGGSTIIALSYSFSIPKMSFETRRIAYSSFSSSCFNGFTIQSPPFLLHTTPAFPLSAASSSASSAFFPKSSKTRLFVSGLSFRTTEESLRNAFRDFGQLVEVNLVMDKIANRPRGFAFLRYETEEESQKAIDGMHGKFLDGRVIFVEFAKSRTELRQGRKHKQF